MDDEITKTIQNPLLSMFPLLEPSSTRKRHAAEHVKRGPRGPLRCGRTTELLEPLILPASQLDPKLNHLLRHP